MKNADVGSVWKVLLLHQLCDGDPIQVDWLASTSAAGFATHEQTEDNERWAAGPSLQNSWRGCIQELVSTRTMHHARVWIIDVIEHGHVYTGLQKGL